MQSLAMQKSYALRDEWDRLRLNLPRVRTQAARDHVARIMLAIEKELAARKCDKPKG